MNFSDIKLVHGECKVPSRSNDFVDISAKLKNLTFKSPLVPANMVSIINAEKCKIFDNAGWLYVYPRMNGVEDVKNFCINSKDFNILSISVGIKDEWVEFIKWLADQERKPDIITLDVALSYSVYVLPIIHEIKAKLPSTILIVGNGQTKAWADFLQNQGVDVIKCNIGVSQACRTYQATGFGSFPLQTLIDLAEWKYRTSWKGYIMSDGGLTVDPVTDEVWVGDIAKAIRFGADFVMNGSIWARTCDTLATKGYFGNASQEVKTEINHIEGETVQVKKNKFTTEETILFIEQSLRSSVSYAGGTSLYDIRNCNYERNL